MTAPGADEIQRVLSLLPAGQFLMTSAYDGKRAGIRLRSVQPCADEPVLICVSARKGHAIDPLIRDSRCFAVCVLADNDRLVERTFPVAGDVAAPDEGEAHDPFDALPITTITTGSPVLSRARAAIDCEVVRHVDLEADHELFVGQVVSAKILSNGSA